MDRWEYAQLATNGTKMEVARPFFSGFDSELLKPPGHDYLTYLNGMGQLGWEMVAVTGGSDGWRHFFMKRRYD